MWFQSMFLRTISLSSLVLAQSIVSPSASQTTSQTASQTTARTVQTHVFSVGANGKTFTPNHMENIPVGDIAEFRFYPLNHSVVRGEFYAEPCIPHDWTGAGKTGGFWSGWMPTAVVDSSTQPVFQVRINDTDPIALYCSSPGSCLLGMLMVINGNATHNINTQMENLKTAKLIYSPNEYWMEEKWSDVDQQGKNGNTTSSDAGSSNTPGNKVEESHPHSLSPGAIAGIAIGGVVVLALLGGLVYLCGRHKSVKDLLKNNSSISPAKETNIYEPASPGYTEANYPNLIKSPAMTESSFGPMSHYGAYSDRSISPPPDERAQSIYGVLAGRQSVQTHSPSWPAPQYEEVHEADSYGVKATSAQVHEMDAPPSTVVSPNTPQRPFLSSESPIVGRQDRP